MKIRNPFVVALASPLYMLVATVAVTNDFLMTVFFVFFNFGIMMAYVNDFEIFSDHYMNEVAHKAAISALAGLLAGLILFLLFQPSGNTVATNLPMSSGGKFFVSWAGMSVPTYFLMIYFVSKINKRDLDAEAALREEKRKNRKSSGPPIMDRDGF
jgi:hypothetical protein